MIGYSRKEALAERAVLPVMFGALDGEASWLDEERTPVGPHRLQSPWPTEATRPALFTALRTGFADHLLREAFQATRDLRADRRKARGLGPAEPARGLGKLLVVAPDQVTARAYVDVVRQWVPTRQADTVRLATSGERDAHEALASFRLHAEPSVLVTVAMAYEGLDVSEVAVVAALTHIRSRPWLEQMIARATRVDPHAGTYECQRALVFHPDDPLFARFRRRIETEGSSGRIRPLLGCSTAEQCLSRSAMGSSERRVEIRLERLGGLFRSWTPANRGRSPRLRCRLFRRFLAREHWGCPMV